MNIFLIIKKLIQKKQLENAIKKANRYKKLTGYKYFVLKFNGKFIVRSKQQIKQQIKQGVIKAKIQDIEKIVAYKTS